MNKLLVSAIITTYGRPFKLIERSILSVEKQTYDNIELILVDDNSPESEYRKDIEENVEKMNEILKIKILYIKHEKNMGAQRARNTGIYNAKGDLYAFLDDDDEWLPEKIKEQVSVYSDDVGLIYTRGYKINEDSRKVEEYHGNWRFYKEATFYDLIHGDKIGTTTTALISKKAILTVGNFDIDQLARQDYEMWLRISQKFKCIGVDKCLFNHYMHNGEQISKNVYKSISGYNNIYKKYYYYFKIYPIAKHKYYKLLLECYKNSKDILGILKCVFAIVINSPKVIIHAPAYKRNKKK